MGLRCAERHSFYQYHLLKKANILYKGSLFCTGQETNHFKNKTAALCSLYQVVSVSTLKCASAATTALSGEHIFYIILFCNLNDTFTITHRYTL